MRGPWFCVAVRVTVLVGCLLTACCGRAPPPSQFPTADKALDRMHATHACSRSLQGEATIDYFGDEGRVRGNLLYLVAAPEKLRFDLFSPFGVTLSTLTSDGERFALFDLKQKAFWTGPAATCNVARFTGVPVPAFALVQMLRGEAPVLVHEPPQATIEYDSGLFSSGRYVIRVHSKHQAYQEVELVPHPDDWNLPWREQRTRVLSVMVEQQGIEIYSAELRGHQETVRAKPPKDPDGLPVEVPLGGPPCSAEVPRRVRIEVPTLGRDVIFRNKEVWHNPSLGEGVFRQMPRAGTTLRQALCVDR